MPKYVKTVSFKSIIVPDPNRDDPVVNDAIRRIEEAGGEVQDIRLEIGGGLSWVSTYMIAYAAEEPIEFALPRTATGSISYFALVIALGVLVLLALALWAFLMAGA
ncbi:MAG: hypothetical protein ACK2UL_06720 [Anaerolineae bacterium]